MTTVATPPAWADDFLRLVVRRADFDAISGDLLEEYRDRIHPARGQAQADFWYVKQIIGFAVRTVGVWGALFGAAIVLRTALDWFVPTSDFSFRSAMSTYFGVGLLLATGFWSAWRSGSMKSGTLSAMLVAALGSLISVIGAAAMLVMFHDRQTMDAIAGSGGLSEVFTMPIGMLVAGLIFGTIGGAIGDAASKKLRLDV